MLLCPPSSDPVFESSLTVESDCQDQCETGSSAARMIMANRMRTATIITTTITTITQPKVLPSPSWMPRCLDKREFGRGIKIELESRPTRDQLPPAPIEFIDDGIGSFDWSVTTAFGDCWVRM